MHQHTVLAHASSKTSIEDSTFAVRFLTCWDSHPHCKRPTCPGRDRVADGLGDTEHTLAGFCRRLARVGIHGSCSWAFDVISFVYGRKHSNGVPLGEGDAGRMECRSPYPVRRPRPGLRYQRGPAKTSCGQSKPDDVGLEHETTADSWKRMPTPSRQLS